MKDGVNLRSTGSNYSVQGDTAQGRVVVLIGEMVGKGKAGQEH